MVSRPYLGVQIISNTINMRIGIIIPSVHWNCPYADIYAKIFDSMGVQYDIISFNRKLDKEDTKYHFDYKLANSSSPLKKLIGNIKYCSFVKKILEVERYDRLVIFSSQLGIGLLGYLKRNYKGRYIFDYRDLSIEQRLKFPFKVLLANSYMNVVSSPGFLKVLPQNFKYEICHNLNVGIAEKAITEETQGKWPSGKRKIITIGGIRDYSANVSVIDAIRNRGDYSLSFVGRGESSPHLAEYCRKNNVSNVSFVGFYKKEEEPGYINKADFINIFYPRVITHDTAVSNRFYNSLIYKKPMITTANTTQGDYAFNYNVGIAIENCNELVDSLENFMHENDYFHYCQRCNMLLEQFINEQRSFEKKILLFIK